MINFTSIALPRSALVLLGAIIFSCGFFFVVWSILSNYIPIASFSPFLSISKDVDRIDAISSYLSTSTSVIDNTINMTANLQIGLFAIVGYSLYKTPMCLSYIFPVMLGAMLFVVFSFISLYLGFAARMEALVVVNTGGIDFDEAITNLWRQGLFLCFSSVSALFVAALSLLATFATVKSTSSHEARNAIREIASAIRED